MNAPTLRAGNAKQVSWDGVTLSIVPRRFFMKSDFGWQKQVTLTRDDVKAISFKAASVKPSTWLGGELLIITDRIEYKIYFATDDADAWRPVADALRPADNADALIEHKRAKTKREAEAAAVRAATASFAGVTLGYGIIDYQGRTYNLPATAWVEAAGGISKRMITTHDNRELYLMVEGVGADNTWAFVVSVNPEKGLKARQFAAKVSGAPGPPPRAAPAVSAAPDGGGVADQLAKLAELHKSGSLSDEEFTAAKAKLLSDD